MSSQVLGLLPVRDISIDQLQDLTADYLETLPDILHVCKDQNSTPLATVIPYHIWQNIVNAVKNAEILAQRVMAQHQAKSKLITG